nr:kinase-interacting family protein [Ziziphus jujuba var. spinosa]
MKMKMEREVVLMGSNQSPQSPSPRSRRRSFCNGNMSTMPVWLLSNLADLEERMKNLEINKIEAENEGDTFAERAECYYRKRPQLLTLLQDLYNSYINLADRYKQAINKHHHHRQVSSIDFDCKEYGQHEDFDGISSEIESEVESSLSYQQPPIVQMAQDDSTALQGDGIVLEFVMKNVEFEILLHELTGMERRSCESSRKIELQKSLLEVLESERLILLNENASLGYRVAALVEENKGLVSESLFMKRRAGELARCVLRMREDQRVSMLSRKIEDLQGQIFGLEKRNKEYYDQLVKREQQLPDDDSTAKTTEKNGNEVALDACFQMGKLNRRLMKKAITDRHRNWVAKKSGSWWTRVKKMDLFLCGLN